MGDNNGGLCPQSGLPCKEVIELATKVEHMEKQQDETKVKVDNLETSVRDVIEFQGGTKVYVAEIKQQLSGLENRLFTFMNDLVKNLTAKDENSDKTAASERDKNMDRWIGFAKYIIGVTIAVIVAYFFGKGGM